MPALKIEIISICCEFDSAFLGHFSALWVLEAHIMDEKRDRLKLQKRFGEHLRKLRDSKELTPAELARRCDMERSNISRLEGGRMNPSLFVLKKLALGMEIEIEELLKGFK